jgi:hypothetical protein
MPADISNHYKENNKDICVFYHLKSAIATLFAIVLLFTRYMGCLASGRKVNERAGKISMSKPVMAGSAVALIGVGAMERRT